MYEFVREMGKERLEERNRKKERGIGRKAYKNIKGDKVLKRGIEI